MTTVNDRHLPGTAQSQVNRRQSECLVHDLIEAVPDPTVIVDTVGRIVGANTLAGKVFGYGQHDLLGKPVDILLPCRFRGIHKQHRMEFAAHPRLRAMRGEVEQLTGQRKDGSEFPAEVSLGPIQTEQGQWVVYVIRDVTRRSQLLAELKATQQQIIQKERLHALGEMASGIAHDFNNALAAIIGYSEILLEAHPEDLNDPVKVRDYLMRMAEAAGQAAEIVRRLRTFYCPRAKGDAFALINLSDVVSRTIALTQPRWKDQALANGVTIHLKTELSDLPPIMADETELQEALTNLIFNAVDALPAGGTITLRTSATDGQLVLEVSDTGVGMTDEVRRRCLEPFFTTKEEKGTGLGLAITYGVVRRHGGTLTIRSAPGQGTTVVIRLPIGQTVTSDDVSDDLPLAPVRL